MGHKGTTIQGRKVIMKMVYDMVHEFLRKSWDKLEGVCSEHGLRGNARARARAHAQKLAGTALLYSSNSTAGPGLERGEIDDRPLANGEWQAVNAACPEELIGIPIK